METHRERISDAAAAHGSVAKTFRGQVRFLLMRKRAGHVIHPVPEPTKYRSTQGNYWWQLSREEWRELHRERRLFSVAIEDLELAIKANSSARRDHPRRKNWCFAQPSVDDSGISTAESTYGGWPRYDYTPQYQSSIVVARSGDVAYLRQSHEIRRRIFAPAGLRWDHDDDGARLVSRDGTDWHPSLVMMRSKTFAKDVRAAMSAKRAAHRQAAKDSRANSRLRRTARVTVHDARVAGNCRSGVVGYVLRRLGRKVSDLPTWFSVPATDLPDQGRREVESAIAAAVRRETLVTI